LTGSRGHKFVEVVVVMKNMFGGLRIDDGLLWGKWRLLRCGVKVVILGEFLGLKRRVVGSLTLMDRDDLGGIVDLLRNVGGFLLVELYRGKFLLPHEMEDDIGLWSIVRFLDGRLLLLHRRRILHYLGLRRNELVLLVVCERYY